MTKTATPRPAVGAHGAAVLPAVIIDDYNAELRDREGFVGDRASNRAFRNILEELRRKLRALGKDPLGTEPSREISKSKLDKILFKGDPEAAGIVHGAVEEFAGELAQVIRRFLALKTWSKTEAIVLGGGLRESRIGELAIGRAAILLKGQGIDIDLSLIRNDPDEAGLIGAAHLAPSWIFGGHDSILALDIGGSNIRAGIVELNLKKAPDLAKASVHKSELWRHRDDKPTRDEAVERIAEMLKGLIKVADEDGLRLAPFIGIGCPGVIREDGAIERGAQNLPGNWEASHFNLPQRLANAVPTLGEHEVSLIMHNDAVVQGLSEAPFMRDVKRWGVLTIGTGLGNARFTTRTPQDEA